MFFIKQLLCCHVITNESVLLNFLDVVTPLKLAFIGKRIIMVQPVGSHCKEVSEEEREAYIVLVNLLSKEAGNGKRRRYN